GQLSNSWFNQVGDIQVTPGGVASGLGSLDVATVNGIGSVNEAVSATVTVAPGQFAGLVARYAGAGDQNMYFGGVVGGSGNYSAYLFRNVGGTWTQLFGQSYGGSVSNAALEFDVVG